MPSQKAYIIFTLQNKNIPLNSQQKQNYNTSKHSKIRSDTFFWPLLFLSKTYEKSGEVSMRIKLCKTKPFRRKKNFWKTKSQHNQYYKVFDSRRFEKFLWLTPWWSLWPKVWFTWSFFQLFFFLVACQKWLFIHIFAWKWSFVSFRANQSHYREVPRWEIFMEQELKFGLDLGWLAVLKKRVWADYEQLLGGLFLCFQGQKKLLKFF